MTPELNRANRSQITVLQRSHVRRQFGKPGANVAPCKIHFSLRAAFSLVNFPFFILLMSQIAMAWDRMQSGNIHGTENPATTYIKYGLVVVVFAMVLWHVPRMGPLLRWYIAAVCGVFAWNIGCNSYDMEASLVSLTRYCTPLLFLLYGWAFRQQLTALISAVLLITIVNDIVQCVMYATYYMSGTSIVPMQIMYGVLPRASGMGGLLAFSLMNFTSAVLSFYCLASKRRLIYCYIFLAFVIAAFPYKLVPVLLLFGVSMLDVRKHSTPIQLIALLLCAIALILVEAQSGVLVEGARRRYEGYAVAQDSARTDSYRVMFESLGKGNLFGQGLGYFGGPVSTEYNSPAYDEYRFSWGDCYGMNTTDTYYPHVFVELGIVGGLLYLALFVLPYIMARRNNARSFLATYFFLCLALFVDSLASFSIQSFDSMMVTALLFGLLSPRSSNAKTNAGTFTKSLASVGAPGNALSLQRRPSDRLAPCPVSSTGP